MLSQSSISSKSRTAGRTAGWARSFLGTARRERTGGAGREDAASAEAQTSPPQPAAGGG